MRQLANLSVIAESVGLSLFVHLLASTIGAYQWFQDTRHGTSEFDIGEL